MYDIPLSRRIFFWTLVALFWLVSAIVIGYAFGYRFSIERGIFIYAGSITLKTTPKDVDIYINGNLVPSPSYSRLNNSYHISGIRPGEYFVEVKSPRHQTWSKKIAVHSGISTEFWNIVLAEKSYQRETFDSAGIEKFFILPHKNLIAFPRQNGNEFSVSILDPESSKTSSVFSILNHAFTDDDRENIEWSPQAHKLIIPTIKNGEKNYFITNIKSKESINLGTLTGDSDISNVRWDPKNKNFLLYMSGNNLYRLNLDSLKNKKLVAKNIASYEVSSKGLFYFQLPQGIVYKIDLDAVENPVQITTTSPENMDDNSYRIIVYDIDRIVFLNRSGNLFVYNKGANDTYFRKLSDNAAGSQFSDDGKKLLFWSNNEISTYFTRNWEEQPARSENEVMMITRFSEPIKNVQWTRDYEHVLFTNSNNIKMIEIDSRDHRNMSDIVQLNVQNPFAINNFADSKIYFTDRSADGQTILNAVDFPEKSSILCALMPRRTPSKEASEGLLKK